MMRIWPRCRSTSGEKWSNPEYILRILLIKFAKGSDMKYERQESRMAKIFGLSN